LKLDVVGSGKYHNKTAFDACAQWALWEHIYFFDAHCFVSAVTVAAVSLFRNKGFWENVFILVQGSL
jgi:hypothetical protein